MDHILKVIPLEGFSSGLLIEGHNKSYLWDWNIVLNRMFPENIEEYQGLCKDCHLNKSTLENR